MYPNKIDLMTQPARGLLGGLMLVMSASIFAQQSAPIINTQVDNTKFKSSFVGEIPKTASDLEEHERNYLKERADEYGLSVEEWLKYEKLMQGTRGLRSPNIDPVWALGIHAQTNQERQRFAELAVQNERKNFEQVMAFQHAFTAAQTRLYGNNPIIRRIKDPLAVPQGVRPLQGDLQPGDRLMYFVDANCKDCKSQVAKLVDIVSKRPGLVIDIFVQGTAGDNAKVQQWARDNELPPRLVRQQVVTLNHDKDTLVTIDPIRTVPTALVRRGDTFWGFEKGIF